MISIPENTGTTTGGSTSGGTTTSTNDSTTGTTTGGTTTPTTGGTTDTTTPDPDPTPDTTESKPPYDAPVIKLSAFAERKRLTEVHFATPMVPEDFYPVTGQDEIATVRRVLLLVVGILLILVSILMLFNAYINRKNRNMYDEHARNVRELRIHREQRR